MNKYQYISDYISKKGAASSSQIASTYDKNQRTVQRHINTLIENGVLIQENNGKNTVYKVNRNHNITANFDNSYLSDSRLVNLPITFNQNIFKQFEDIDIFTAEEKRKLEEIISAYNIKLNKTAQELKKREIERLIIEFSWKSSQIEGNTYSLLETEDLLTKNVQTKRTHTTYETQMILNHKSALEYIISQPFKLSKKYILEIHQLLTKNLEISSGFRVSSVGITGSLYRPPEVQYLITEAVESMIGLLKLKKPLEQALLVTLFISYIQPFTDGNKRTARLLSNAILHHNNLPLLSYRTTTPETYRDAMILFYELNNIAAYKKIFIEQIEYYSKYYL